MNHELNWMRQVLNRNEQWSVVETHVFCLNDCGFILCSCTFVCLFMDVGCTNMS